MVDHRILVDTATLYRRRAKDDDSYALPSEVLNDVTRRLGLEAESSVTEIRNSDQFVVVRTLGISGEPELVRHPLDLVESGIVAGVETLKARGMLDVAHICLIAVPRGSLTGTFTCIYEVARRCGWSVLPLGGSVDGQDISRLCSAYAVDTIVIAADAIEEVFVPDLVGRFDDARDVLYVSGLPSQSTLDTLTSNFPHLKVNPFLYMSDVIGPIGRPIAGHGDRDFEVLDNVLVEVEATDGGVALNGSGEILVSVLGLEEPALIRRRIGDLGALTTSDEGRQVVRLSRRSPR
jgi:hypothetical protein